VSAATTTARLAVTRAVLAGRRLAGLRQEGQRLLDRPLTSYYLVLGSAAMLLVLGLIMVLAASTVVSMRRYGSPYSIFELQFRSALLGLPLMWLAYRLPVRTLRVLAYPILLGSIVLLGLVLTPGIGRSVNGNQNWIDFGGPFRIQPSELAKLALVLWGADLLARKRKLLHQWKHLLVPLVPATGVILMMIMAGQDLGTSVIVVAILFGLLWVAGAPVRLFVGMSAAGLAVVTLLVRADPDRLARVQTLFASCDSEADYLRSCWQAKNSIFALANGGFWGQGLGAGFGKWGWVPEAHTDAIFAIIGEDLGLVGTLAVLGLFGVLGYAGLRIAHRTRDPFVRLAAGAVTMWVMVQAMVNVAAVLRLLPIAGVPLPLVSYGGSALLPTMFALGMLLSFARREPGARAALAVRGPGPVRRALAGLVAARPRLRPRPVPAVPRTGARAGTRTGAGTRGRPRPAGR
jgi:cell division protein FtsW